MALLMQKPCQSHYYFIKQAKIYLILLLSLHLFIYTYLKHKLKEATIHLNYIIYVIFIYCLLYFETMKILAAWLGDADIRASISDDGANLGPIAQALQARKFDRLILLANWSKEKVSGYQEWLSRLATCEIDVEHAELSSPIDFQEIYDATNSVLTAHLENLRSKPNLTFHLSPGTGAMQAIWIILGKTKFPAELIQSSPQRGVETANIPFEISAELIANTYSEADKKFKEVSTEIAPESAKFGDIIYRSVEMQNEINKAQKIAPRNLTVLIEGESGTGKELFARAIHSESPRSENDMVSINCGAFPKDLIPSLLFGHKKGTFTGATSDRPGIFEKADGTTLFLDEIGELPLEAQATLLRVLDTGSVSRVGEEEKEREVDVRIIAATNKNLLAMVHTGEFREDLYYRLADVTFRLPPLRDRRGDLGLLINKLLVKINHDSRKEQGYINKKLSTGAKNLLLSHPWPGNVRELQSTLRRAVFWSDEQTITKANMQASIQSQSSVFPKNDEILNRSIEEGVVLEEIIDEVKTHYLKRAWEASGKRKTKTAKLLGYANYQVLSKLFEKYEIR